MSSPEQESYSEDETDRSARTGDSQTLKSTEIKGLRISFFRIWGAEGGSSSSSAGGGGGGTAAAAAICAVREIVGSIVESLLVRCSQGKIS